MVTRASKSIGAEVAKHLAAEGATVVVNDASSKVGTDKIAAKGGRNAATRGDASNPEDIKRLFVQTQHAFGRPGVLTHNAGVYEFGSLEEMTPERFHRPTNLNVVGLILTTLYVADGDR